MRKKILKPHANFGITCPVDFNRPEIEEYVDRTEKELKKMAKKYNLIIEGSLWVYYVDRKKP